MAQEPMTKAHQREQLKGLPWSLSILEVPEHGVLKTVALALGTQEAEEEGLLQIKDQPRLPDNLSCSCLVNYMTRSHFKRIKHRRQYH